MKGGKGTRAGGRRRMDSDEGVTAGFSVLDSLLLVDV